MKTITQLPPEEFPTCDLCGATPIEDILAANAENWAMELREIFLVHEDDGTTLAVCARCKTKEGWVSTKPHDEEECLAIHSPERED